MDTPDSLSNITWEEVASELPRSATDTQRFMTAIYYRFQIEGKDTSEVTAIEKEYFPRVRWPRPTNLSATANYCASQGWLTTGGIKEKRKQWSMTRKGANSVEEYLRIN
jgi:hypothetical protein